MPRMLARLGPAAAVLYAALCTPAASAGVDAGLDDERAARVRYVQPSAFRQLPERVVRALDRLGCRVPQAVGVPRPNNVIRGKFRGPNEHDWAILCSRNARSQIMIFDARADDPVEISGKNAETDARYIDVVDDGVSGFGRVIGVADRAYILQHDEWYGNDPPLPPIDHDGIDDAFGMASVIHYRYRGNWRELQGAD